MSEVGHISEHEGAGFLRNRYWGCDHTQTHTPPHQLLWTSGFPEQLGDSVQTARERLAITAASLLWKVWGLEEEVQVGRAWFLSSGVTP